MDAQFIAIIQKLTAEKGKEALFSAVKSKALLADYTRGEYAKESRLLLQAVEAGAAKNIAETAELANCKLLMVKKLQDDHFLSEGAAADVVDMLALVLRGDTSRTQTSEGNTGNNAPITPRPTPAKPAPSPAVKLAPVEMVLIQRGTFKMGFSFWDIARGLANEDGRELPQHSVTISSFYLGKYMVTQKEWQEVMETNPSNFKGDNLPVEPISWYDAVEYCNQRSRKEGLTPGYTINGSGDGQMVTWNRNTNGYRLPTEAEWEYACRAGTTTPFSTGNDITTEQANYNGLPLKGKVKGENRKKIMPVGSFAPNPWGLYDMHGNAAEWCWDWFGRYSSEAQTDPSGPASGSFRVFRGGSYIFGAYSMCSARRTEQAPSKMVCGFRLARNAD